MIALPARRPATAPTLRDTPAVRRAAALLIATILFAFVMRAGQFGDPIAGLDEQFYLLVGDRMWSGALPYVDIWDRKPAGLFVLYAAIRGLPGDGILAYQIVATIALALTGWTVALITARTLPCSAALAAGWATIVYGILFGTGFGQSPIFYDLLTVVAGACVLGVASRPGGTTFDSRAFVAMALCGIALTVKTSAIFESCCFGLLLLHDDWRRGCGWRAGLIRASGYVVLGVLPTLAFVGFYAWNGQFDAFVFANFQSVFLRSEGATQDSFARCIGLLLLLSPLILPAVAEWRHLPAASRRIFGAWTIAGFLSFVAIGRCYEHYALPLITPLALLAAYGLRGRAVVAGACAFLLLIAGFHAANAGVGAKRDRQDFAALLAAIPAAVRTECLFVYEGPVILYSKTGACLPGRYIFPGHFTEAAEAAALEEPSEMILRDTLDRRPLIIVMAPDSRGGAPLTTNDRILRDVLRQSYRPIARQPIRLYGTQRIDAMVWQRT